MVKLTGQSAACAAAAPPAAPRRISGALSESLVGLCFAFPSINQVSQTALHSLLSTLPTSVAPRGPAAGDAGGEPMRVS